jgi:CubicO group peptidase (beta-lactamase class C family)
VKEVYEREMQTMAEKNTQLCVYYKGERVVDLWASVTNDARFSPDSIVNIFSSGKSLEAIAIASLVGRGLLDYKAKIVDYWPEFGANGKGELTVADLMRHEGGLTAFNTSLDPEDLLPENIKQNSVGKVIEGHPARFRKGNGNKREYHAITRGWIVNEVFRRVDPGGRTLGEYLREEISGPLEADAIIGVNEAELDRISKFSLLGFMFQFLQSLKPRILGRKIKHSFFQILGRLLRVIPYMRHATTRGAPPPYKGMKGIGFFNEPVVAMGETPSAAANCSARGLAKIAAMMSIGGKWAGREFLSEEAWKAMHEDPVEAEMGFGATHFTQGGVNLFVDVGTKSTGLDRAFNVGREGFYGWMGFGGSIFQWHPQHQIGFGFVPTSLHVLDIVNERGKVYQAEVLRCVGKLKE